MANRMDDKPKSASRIFNHCVSVIDASSLQEATRSTLQVARHQLAMIDQPSPYYGKQLQLVAQLNRAATTLMSFIESGELDDEGLLWYDEAQYRATQAAIDKIIEVKDTLTKQHLSLEVN